METTFHATRNGCDLIQTSKQVGMTKRNVPKMLLYQHCETHVAEVCRCGWEFGKHPVSQEK